VFSTARDLDIPIVMVTSGGYQVKQVQYYSLLILRILRLL